MMAEAGIEASVSLGVDYESSTIMTWIIPKNTTRTIEAGYRFVHTEGEFYELDGFGNRINTEVESGEWFLESFSR